VGPEDLRAWSLKFLAISPLEFFSSLSRPLLFFFLFCANVQRGGFPLSNVATSSSFSLIPFPEASPLGSLPHLGSCRARRPTPLSVFPVEPSNSSPPPLVFFFRFHDQPLYRPPPFGFLNSLFFFFRLPCRCLGPVLVGVFSDVPSISRSSKELCFFFLYRDFFPSRRCCRSAYVFPKCFFFPFFQASLYIRVRVSSFCLMAP